MHFAYVASEEPITIFANKVRCISFPGYEIQERDGLNVGGGQYFKIFCDTDHAVVCFADHGDPPSPEFEYAVYLPRQNPARLERIASELAAAGYKTEIARA